LEVRSRLSVLAFDLSKRRIIFSLRKLPNPIQDVTLYVLSIPSLPIPTEQALTTLPVCPSCSNVLTVSTTTVDSSSEGGPSNRLECLTCPYQYILTKRFYERKTFMRKEREDVFGGPGAWDNAQKAKMQCPKEGCNGDEAAFFQVQIRSADEPMTGFYKVSLWRGSARWLWVERMG
jgi:DNA-directed RNA polymerase III subunit RPC11